MQVNLLNPDGNDWQVNLYVKMCYLIVTLRGKKTNSSYVHKTLTLKLSVILCFNAFFSPEYLYCIISKRHFRGFMLRHKKR